MCHPERRAQPEAEGSAVCLWPRQRRILRIPRRSLIHRQNDQTQERKSVILNEGRSPKPKDLQFAYGRAKGASFSFPEDHSFIGGK